MKTDRQMKYKDLFIDFDDTLFDTSGNGRISLKELFDEFHLGDYFEDPNIFLNAYWLTNVQLWSQYAKGEISRDYLIIERFKRPLLKGKGLEVTDDYCLKMSDRFLEICATKTGLVEGARELLDYLKQKGYHMHLCSNGFHEVQYKKLNVTHLTDYFDHVILSEDAGANKPSQAFFDYAFKTCGATASTTLMIGDNFDTDIAGAMDAGLDTLFFNRWDPTYVPPRKPNYTVNKLMEIIGKGVL